VINAPAWLYPAYALNTLVLVPVVYSMFAGAGVANVFEGKVADSPGLRLLVASFWCAILLASLAGLVWPQFFAPLLLVQILYKALWLMVFVVPLMRSDMSWPVGISAVFAFIVLTYPVLIWLAIRPAPAS
jgi:hypothetical protein